MEFTPWGDYLSMLPVQTLFSLQSDNPVEFQPFTAGYAFGLTDRAFD